MKGRNFKAKILNGEIRYDLPGEYRLLKKELEGEDVLVRIDKWYKPRSDKQNRYYWGVIVQILSDSTGEDDLDAIHDALKEKFIPKMDVLGEKVAKSTKIMTTAEMEKYFADIRMWASRDLHTYIPEPNEAPGFAYDI